MRLILLSALLAGLAAAEPVTVTGSASGSSTGPAGQTATWTTERQAEIIALADRMSAIAAENAERHDRDNTFPFDTYDALRESGFLALAVPEELGGFGATPLELMLAQQRLGWGDGSVALSSTMHHLQTAGVANNLQWPPELRERVLRDVVEHGALINSIASEPERYEGQVVIKREILPDGRHKLILKDEATGDFSDRIVAVA